MADVLGPVRALHVVRHAPAVTKGFCYGRRDVAVAPAAGAAAKLVVQQLPVGLQCIYSSPSKRALSLASALARLAGLPVHVDARLLELDFGTWEGRSWDAIHQTEPDALDAWAKAPLLRAPTQGETGQALIARLHDFTRELGEKTALLVCHAGPIRALRALASLPRSLRQPEAVQTLDFTRSVPFLSVETLPWG